MEHIKRFSALFLAIIFSASVFITGGAETTFLLGDVNNDGKVTAADARITLLASAKLYSAPDIESADIDNDNRITAIDARYILRAAAKLESLVCIRYGHDLYDGSCINCNYTEPVSEPDSELTEQTTEAESVTETSSETTSVAETTTEPETTTETTTVAETTTEITTIPETTTIVSETTTIIPEESTTAPETTTTAPETTTKETETTTETTTSPETTTEPESTTKASETTTSAPEATTIAPEESTTAPETTTVVPETTTKEAETTTEATTITETTTEPESTTKAPETTTSAPEATTIAPEESTTAPETTTTAPETTTTIPEESTTAPETTTSAPETTTETTIPETTTKPVSTEELAYETFLLINEYRASLGLYPLTFNAELSEITLVRAKEASVLWSHTRPDGRDFWSVFDDYNKFNAIPVGEILAKTGAPDAARAVNGWRNSPSHNAILTTTKYNEIGIACYIAEDGYTYFAAHTIKTNNNESTTVPEESTTTGSTTPPVSTEDLAYETFLIINEYRASHGLYPLTFNAELSEITLARAKEIYDCGGTTRPDGSSYHTIFDDYNKFNNCSVVELSAKFKDPVASQVVASLYNSPLCDVMLTSTYTQIGVAYYFAENGYYYFVLHMIQ